MSYCVNCGVELDVSAVKCALCSTPVINPNITVQASDEKPFADELQIPKGMKKRFVAFFITMTMLVPNIVMFFLNVFFIRDGFWSLYVLSACSIVWVIFVLPFFMKNKIPLLLWIFDTAAVTAFTFVLLGLLECPVQTAKSIISVLLFTALAILFIVLWLGRKKRHWTSIFAFFLAEAFVVSLLSGVAVYNFTGIYNFFVIGVVIAVCAAVMMAFFTYCSKSKHIRAWLNKVFYL